MIWYDYLTEPIWKKGSFVAVYDKKTKKVSKAFDDDGNVLYYADNRFYTQYKNKVYSVDKKGKNYKKISDSGSLEGVFNKNYIVVNEKDKSKIYKKGKKESELRPSLELTDGHYAIYSKPSSESYPEYVSIWCKDLKSKKAAVLLGTIELRSLEMEADDYHLLEMKRKNSDIYFSISVFTGNAHYLNGGVLYKANPKKKNSLKLITKNLFNDDYSIIKHFDVDNNGKVKTFVGDKPARFEGKKLYFYQANGKKKLITADFPKLLGSKGGYDITYDISDDAYIDGNLFMIVSKHKPNPSKDIGWRSAYDIIDRYYVRVPINNADNTQILYKYVFK